MNVMRSVCQALLALGAILLVGCSALAPGEAVAFDGETLDAQASGKQGFGFGSFRVSTFQDTNGDGLPDTRLSGEERPTTEVPDTGNALTPPAIKADRKMVYQGRMQVEVAQVDEAIERYTAKVHEWGGHLGSRENATITVRVPALRFDDAVAELRGYGRVLSEAMQANDVTSQHLDLTIRLENAQKSRERLLALLQRAEKVEDMLKIEEQLHRLTEEIERMTGQLRFMNDQIAFSTLAVAFQGVSSAQTGRRGKPASMFQWINRIGVEPLRRGF